MKIHEVRIRNFRSINDITLKLDNMNIIVGANSTGKSNILSAIKYAFSKKPSQEEIYENLPAGTRGNQGGPKFSTYVDFKISQLPKLVRKQYQMHSSDVITYSFRAIRTGNITRRFGSKDIDDSFDFNDHISLISVPAIRDLTADGLLPFRKLFSESIKRGRGINNLEKPTADIRRILKVQADRVLSYQSELASDLIGAEYISVDASSISLSELFETLPLLVEKNGQTLPLESLGTGHQSAVIMNFFRQLGESGGAPALFLFEEPDNHMHPTSVRLIAEELSGLSENSQVILTSHSPVLVDHFGLNKVMATHIKESDGSTSLRRISFDDSDERRLNAYLREYGLRATEPLFSKAVVLVEGPTDAIVLSKFIERKAWVSPLNMGVLVLPVGSKARMPEFCNLMSKMDIPWYAILDEDAAWRDAYPTILTIEDEEEQDSLLEAVDKISEIINFDSKVGRKANNDLKRIKDELENGSPEAVALTNTPLEGVLLAAKVLTKDDMQRLKIAIGNERVTDTRNILIKANVWVWSRGALEETLIGTVAARKIVVDFLVATGVFNHVRAQNLTNNEICSYLKRNVLNVPEKAVQFVDYGYDNGLFNRSEITKMYNALLAPLMS